MVTPVYRVDTVEFNTALRRYWAYSRKSISEITLAQARLFAVELARRTQPFGFGKDAQGIGMQAVRRDILRVFTWPSRMIAYLGGLKTDRGAGLVDWMIAALQANRLPLFMDAWRTWTGRSLVANETVDRGFHQRQRNKRGRVSARFPRQMLVMKQGEAESYLKEKEKLVGFGKSGWASAARDLGGTRGIPGWVTRNAGPGVGSDLTRDGEFPRVVLANEVTYASDIIPESEMSRAATVQTEKMARAIDIALGRDGQRAGIGA